MNAVAVVIPCHNLGRTVVEAVDSVERQTRPATELLVLDDGSTDPYTRHVLAALCRRGVAVVGTANHGVAAARNLGVSLTFAPYLVLLDADDRLAPDFIARLAGHLDAHPDIDFVTSGIEAFGGASYRWTPAPCSWIETLARGGPHVSTMMRRTVWNRVPGFDTALPGYEDLDFWLSAIEAGARGAVIDAPLLEYRVRAGSRYRRALVPERYLTAMARIREKHPLADRRAATDLLAAVEHALEEQRHHRAALRSRRRQLSERRRTLDAGIAALGQVLHAAGEDTLTWGDFRTTSPLSPVWGTDRGEPVDRFYIHTFLARHGADIQGRVAEIKDAGYTTRFGTNVTGVDVVDVNAANPRVTLCLDLSRTDDAPEDTFDCFILTQTIHLIADTAAVVRTAFRMLKPGGVLLCTVPCVSRVSYEDNGLDGDHWRFTEASIRLLFSHVFPVDGIEVEPRGNVLACAAFLTGLAASELRPEQLHADDPSFPLVCCIRAVKPRRRASTLAKIGGQMLRAPHRQRAGVVLLYHRIGSPAPDTHGLAVAPDAFERQMEWVRQRGEPLPLRELVERARDGSLPPRAMAITFDDGYADALTTVSPVLTRLGLPATFFVNTDRLNERHECWWDVLERIWSAESLPPVFEDGETGIGPISTSSAWDRSRAQRALFEAMYVMGADARQRTLDRVAGWAGLALLPRESHRPMTGDEITRLGERAGHDIGVHTIHHLALPLHPQQIQADEMARSREVLERLVGRPITALAYPYGVYSVQTAAIAGEAGFDLAVTTEPHRVGVGVRRPFVPRIEIRRSMPEAAFDLLFGGED